VGPDYLQQQSCADWHKESRNLHWFGLRDGMSVLDLGCGPGHFTERLADSLPAAKITALDAEDRSLVDARRRLDGRAVIVQGRAEATGLPSNTFDFVLARLLFQHLREPLPVAEEALRLLKPGGKLVITDVDDELFGIVEPRVPGFGWLRDMVARRPAAAVIAEWVVSSFGCCAALALWIRKSRPCPLTVTTRELRRAYRNSIRFLCNH
jgi:ubiquinone/menaquinone biosynthesis C-methylase UbiE